MTKYYGYNYRKRHFICGTTAGAQTSYPVMFKIYLDRGADGGQSVYLNGHSLSNLNDVRFYNQSGTKLDYWIETLAADLVTNRWAYVWVEIDSIPTTGCMIDIVYGKVNDAGESSGDNTFSFFDDFLGSSLDTSKWSITESNGTVSQSGTEVIVTSTGDGHTYLNSISSFGVNYCFRSRIKSLHFNNATLWERFALSSANGGVDAIDTFYSADAAADAGHMRNYQYPSTQTRGTIAGVTADTYHILDIYRSSAISGNIWNINGGNAVTITDYYKTTPYKLFINTYYNTSKVTSDWVLVRKYISPEPAHSDYGNEEGDYPSSFTAWNYRKKVDIGNASGSALTGYQMMLNIYRSSGTSAGTSVYVGTNCLSTFADLRFTDAYGNACPYWIESITSTTSAVVWVKVPYIPTTGTFVYLYYGQPGATNNSDGNATFDFFDDFLGSSLDTNKWSVVNTDGSYTVGNSILQITGGSGTAENILSKSLFGVNYTTVGRIKSDNWDRTNGPYEYFGMRDVALGANRVQAYYCGGTPYNKVIATRKDSGTVIQTAFTGWSAGTYYTHSFDRTPTSVISKINGGSSVEISDQYPTADMGVFIGATEITSIYSDWVLVRKYQSPEPTFAHWYNEEQNVQKFQRSQMLNRIRSIS